MTTAALRSIEMPNADDDVPVAIVKRLAELVESQVEMDQVLANVISEHIDELLM